MSKALKLLALIGVLGVMVLDRALALISFAMGMATGAGLMWWLR